MNSRPGINMDTARERLLALREALVQASADGADDTRTVEEDRSRIGRLSRVAALHSQAMAQERERRRRLHLQRVDTALTRIDQHEYGECVTCGEAIDPRRLTADPAAVQCIGCAGKAEREREKQ